MTAPTETAAVRRACAIRACGSVSRFAVIAIWFALRDVDLDDVAEEFRRAHWGVLLGISVPAYLVAVWLRALRWRHLTDAIQPMPRAALFRAVAVGFMANNMFPLRIGELVRVGYLARETRAPTAAVLATVVLERVIEASPCSRWRSAPSRSRAARPRCSAAGSLARAGRARAARDAGLAARGAREREVDHLVLTPRAENLQ